jgi:hypothetical protein
MSSSPSAGTHTGPTVPDLPCTYHGSTSNDNIDLIGILSPGPNGTYFANGPNQNPEPDYNYYSKSITKTDDARGSIQYLQLQLSSDTQIPPEHKSHLAVQEKPNTDVNSQSPPSCDSTSVSHLAFRDRPQLYEWLNETSNSNITVTERLEKFNWELYEFQTPPIAGTGCLLRELDILASL